MRRRNPRLMRMVWRSIAATCELLAPDVLSYRVTPILLPPGDYDEQGIFWTPGDLLPPEEPPERPAMNDTLLPPEATLEDVS